MLTVCCDPRRSGGGVGGGVSSSTDVACCRGGKSDGGGDAGIISVAAAAFSFEEEEERPDCASCENQLRIQDVLLLLLLLLSRGPTSIIVGKRKSRKRKTCKKRKCNRIYLSTSGANEKRGRGKGMALLTHTTSIIMNVHTQGGSQPPSFHYSCILPCHHVLSAFLMPFLADRRPSQLLMHLLLHQMVTTPPSFMLVAYIQLQRCISWVIHSALTKQKENAIGSSSVTSFILYWPLCVFHSSLSSSATRTPWIQCLVISHIIYTHNTHILYMDNGLLVVALCFGWM